MILCLCAGETRANRVVVLAASASCSSVICLDLGAEQDDPDVEPDLLAHLARDELVVTRDHLDRDAVRLSSPIAAAHVSFGGSRNAM